jgi:hypothetical protein
MRRLNVKGLTTLGLTAVLLLGFQQTADAQALLIILFGDKLSTEKFQLGINADLVWSGYTGAGSSDPRFSWAFGAYGEIKLSEHWHLQPELTIKTPVGAQKMPVTTAGSPFQEPTGDATLDSIRANGTLTRSGNQITIPLLVKYVVGNGRFQIGAGGMIGFLTSASDELVSDVERGALNLKASSTDSLNTFDAGLVASLSYALKPQMKMRSMRVDAKFYYGLTDTVKDNPGDAIRNWALFVGIDLPVGGSDAAKEDGDEDS